MGNHIRQRRLDLGLHQKDVAIRVNATTSTVTNWEKGRSTPRLKFLPKIFDFIGYDPYSPTLTNIGESIKNYRRLNGLSIKRFAKKLDIDPTTLAKWERGSRQPSKKLSERLRVVIGH